MMVSEQWRHGHGSFGYDSFEPMKIPTRSMMEPMKVATRVPLDGNRLPCALQEPMTLPSPDFSQGSFSCFQPSDATGEPWCLPANSRTPPRAPKPSPKPKEIMKDAVDSTSALCEGYSLNKFAKPDNLKVPKDEQGSIASHVTPSSPESDSPKSSPADPDVPAPSNKGSLGHPDFCSRPCLYFAAGACFNGISCEFCHISHDKRLLHLDKRNRHSLRNLTFVERLTVLLPVIMERAEALALKQSLACIAELQQLVKDRDELEEQVSTQPATTKVAREHKKLRGMLRGFRVQELFKLLKPQEAPPSMQIAVDILACQMLQEGIERASTTAKDL